MISPHPMTAAVSRGMYQPPVYAAASGSMGLRWRFRSTHPWTTEEYNRRDEAFRRYFYLLNRGVEIELQPGSAS